MIGRARLENLFEISVKGRVMDQEKIIMHIVGNRPQFIKLAPLSKELHRRGCKDIIIHTGQHYDENMSDIFFTELGIDRPAENLQIGSGTHAEITARAMVGVERVVLEKQPLAVVVYGDTDTTLAAAMACRKLNIPIIHVEAGGRTYSKENPEEINRIVVDHMSEICFCPDRQCVKNLKHEGITENTYFTGDIMYDTFLQTKEKYQGSILEDYGLEKESYVLMTWHRQENTDHKGRMEEILDFLEKIPCKILYPMHPRTKKMLKHYDLWARIGNIENLILTDPLGYEEMVYLQDNCRVILTDSGGLSKESAFAGVRCLFMLNLKVWPDLERIGWLKHICFSDQESVEEALRLIKEAKKENIKIDFYGDGHAAERMVSILENSGFLGV